MSFKINLVPTEFAVTRSGLVSGPVWFTVAEEAFPDEHWLDFVEPAFSTWVREAFSLALGINGSARLVFMDGPYVAMFELRNSTPVIANFSEYGVSREFLIDPKEFGKALADAIRLLAQGFRAKGLEADEWERYEVALSSRGIGV